MNPEPRTPTCSGPLLHGPLFRGNAGRIRHCCLRPPALATLQAAAFLEPLSSSGQPKKTKTKTGESYHQRRPKPSEPSPTEPSPPVEPWFSCELRLRCGGGHLDGGRAGLLVLQRLRTGKPRPPVPEMGMGQNESTRMWTAGFSPCVHLPGFHSEYLFLTHSQIALLAPRPAERVHLPSLRRTARKAKPKRGPPPPSRRSRGLSPRWREGLPLPGPKSAMLRDVASAAPLLEWEKASHGCNLQD